MTAAPKFNRKAALAKIHVAKKQLALDDGTYRALLKRVTAKESSADMGEAELGRVLDEFKRLGWADRPRQRKRAGERPIATSALASKIRALWLSLYHLGEIEDPSEQALARFATRMVDVEALQWLTPGQADRVIKALQGWCLRVGYWRADASAIAGFDRLRHNARLPALAEGYAAKSILLHVQWRKLEALKAAPETTLGEFLAKHHGAAHPALLDPQKFDPATEHLGRLLRATRKAKPGG